MTRRAWTPEDRQAAWRMRCAGQTLQQIGDALGRSTNAVHTCVEAIRRANARKPRTCLCCGKTFASVGPQNRMCPRCARLSISPFAL